MVTPVSAQQATQTVNSGIGALASNYETFLSLLTTQLKNQDPLSPLDNNQFTQQLTSMTGVQQQLLTNQLLTQMIAQNQADLGGGAINLIGKLVTVSTNDTALANGSATWNFDLSALPEDATVEVVDSAGRAVFTTKPTGLVKGANSFTWDGKASNGIQMNDGIYSLRVSATDANKTDITASGTVSGIASRIRTVNGQMVLTVGSVQVPLNAVTGVETPPPTTGG
jgi:flagellar basal-body rod modification protein FlgD